MTTLAELADSFNTVITAVDLAVQHRAGAPADEAGITRQKMASQLVGAWMLEADAFLNPPEQGRMEVPPNAAQQAHANLPAAAQAAAVGGGPQAVMQAAMTPQTVAAGPLADTLAKIAAGLQQAPAAPPAPAPAPPPGVQGSFDEWVALADALGRNVQDVMRRWHEPRDGIEGGWDKATDAQRAEQMAKALAYYQNKAAEPGEIDASICFKCGTKAEELKTRSGDPFFKCQNSKCGFNGTNGWVPTMWDYTNRSEKAEKWEQSKRRGQQRVARR